ncbi:protein dachsous-like [Limulus polyphemus]|uniref:Protein dachsous-like n=1 Tax=Limulus polyphemus TaxID=6850 RepID=A0ABM1S2P0_LIMPO|nr:protein dachsous-like [Limulus polyphemus]
MESFNSAPKMRLCRLISERTAEICLLVLSILLGTLRAEYLQEFEISEGVGISTTIGHIGQNGRGLPKPPQPPYLIVPVPGSAVDSDLHIDQSTGEIRTNVVLDREVRSFYSFVAIPLSGENIRVSIKVKDENDNAPEFSTPIMTIDFPENTPKDVKRTLNPAKDRDLGLFNTQRYKIVSGNVNNAFRLSSHRERDEVLYLDLQINGVLDRETTPFYTLVIEAYDGGTPPMKGSMTVNITIQDVNDNQPIFNQSRYFATVAENATLGTSVLRVFATDTDSGENGRTTYSINRRQSDRENIFVIDPKTGVISVNKPLDFESRDVHELVVVARDNGAQPLETTAFVSIRITDVNDNQPTINLIFLSDDASPKISEDAKPGEFVARISVNDPDSKEEYANVNVTLQGGDGHFGLTTQDNIIYLVIVSYPLDREVRPNYTMVVSATDQGNPPLNASRTFELAVTDTNDNAPEFDHIVYYAYVLEVADPGTSVFQLSAVDRDEGNNSLITYSIKHTPETHSKWFQIDSKTGLITTRTHIDCETDPMPQVTVVATDGGSTPLSSSTTVIVTISDVNDNEPIFDQSFYNVTVRENEDVGKCILKVSATDPDCGVNAMVNYTLSGGKGTAFSRDFTVHVDRGELCIRKALNYELRNSYEIPVLATDRGGLSTTAMIKVQVIDVNDNKPIFYPGEYNVSLREQTDFPSPVVVVVASDSDSDIFGHITYHIESGNNEGLFRIDKNTGEIFVTRQLDTNIQMHHLIISATDGGGFISDTNAHVYVSILNPSQQPPIFEQARYSFSVREDVSAQTVVGTVLATSTDQDSEGIKYSIYSGDPEGYFTINPVSGSIATRGSIDHETHPVLLLNVQATSGHPPSYGHTQVKIEIWDVNDNSPYFESTSLTISVPESTELQVPIYVTHAEDLDSSKNGAVHYQLVQEPHDVFSIDRDSGSIMVYHHLDYEKQQQYVLMVRATDGGVPPLSSTMTLTVEVQDVNDNPPVFIKTEYNVNILESLPVNSQFLQVTAADKDTGNNARLTYKLNNSKLSDKFGIFPNSGFLYLREMLDREERDQYTLSIFAVDNGSPSQTASTTVFLHVLDDNDNDPEFIQKNFVFKVEENTEKGRLVGTVSATDKDLGNNASLRYSLLNSNNTFQINPITGELYTKHTLDREKQPVYELSTEVRDQGTPSRSSQAIVQVQVTDVNDNSPVFVEPTDRVIEVREEQPKGTETVRVHAVDADEGENSSVVYDIVPGTEKSDGSSVFSIHKTQGRITTKRVLDHEDQQAYILTVVARDHGLPQHETFLQLKIKVLDLNDNQPIFPTSSFTFRIAEGFKVGEEVGLVQAVDQDGGENGRITYSILGGNLYGVFDIDKTSGSLFTVREIDYEMTPEYILQVKALDSSTTNPRSSVISVKVDIEDVNDCAPVFEADPIIFSIPESTEPGSNVWKFTATDNDSGVNSLLKYAITHQSPASVFKIDQNTGELTLTHTLDYEEFPEYTIVVTATDQAKKVEQRQATSVTCKMIIEDENDNSPVFQTRNQVEVMEDEPVGFPLLNIIATDKDARDNGHVSYTISKGNEKGHFALDHETGLLSIAFPLDREDSHFFELNITASDHGKPPHSTFKLLKIHVQDVNDNSPRFEQPVYKANISENSRSGTFVIKVQAIDKDLGINGNLTYVIPMGIANDKFTIESQTGKIFTKALLDREEQPRYFITVYVKDGAFPEHYNTTTVEVELLDVNDHAPVFTGSCYPLEVPENSEHSVVHTVVASDLDAGQNAEVTYTITGGNVGSKFSIDPYSGELSSGPLDREQIALYSIIITARDRGQPSRSGSCNITIVVLDQNDNSPQFEQSEYRATLSEDAPINTTVLVIHAQDRDQHMNSKITYSLSNETLSLFKIDSESGVVTSTGHFNREKRDSYKFEVQATDSGKYDARLERAIVYVSVADVNDNRPVFLNYPYFTTVSAHAHPGTQVVHLEANDGDEGPNAALVYSFVSSAMAGKFHLDRDSGMVTVSGSLLSDAGTVFHIEVTATDRGRPAKTTLDILEIYVENGTPPPMLKFQNKSYIIELPENAPMGLEVTTVKVSAPSGRSVVITYSLINESPEGAFSISRNSGVIRVKNSSLLDFERFQTMKVLIVAKTEEAEPVYGYTALTVHLVDQNDNPPRFAQEHYTASVWEGNHKSTYVTQVSALDEDQGGIGNIIYHIIDGNHDNAFVIEPPYSGIVKTNIVLDREIRDTYHLTIIATDEGTPQLTGTCTLRITIVDINDNQPVFPPHNVVSISEGAKVGTVITTITANDVDTNPPLIYSFAAGGNPSGIFSIDRFSGHITLTQPLDHEKQKQYQLQIQASDSAHLAETYLIVHVTDINDNAPVFSQNSYEVHLPELVSPGYEVLKINATDEDTGINAHISYSLVSTSVEGFYINEKTGMIHTNKSLAFDPKQPVLHLVVTAKDKGNPSLFSAAAVQVHLKDINDNAPKFSKLVYSTHVSEESEPGTTVTKVSATDLDKSRANSNIFYNIISGNVGQKFSIDGNNGEIILVKVVDREETPNYSLKVMAMDRGSPVKNSTAEVLIYIDDINDHAPSFNQSHYEASVSEMAPIGTSVIQVMALDKDEAAQANIIYDITSGNSNTKFHIDSQTGMITLIDNLDYDLVPEYKFIVRATDNDSEHLMSALASVTINIADENDHEPYFPLQMYTEFVEENTPAGTSVFVAQATDGDRGIFGKLNYSLSDGEGKEKFNINTETGVVTTGSVFDYESKNRYYFTIMAVDKGGKYASVQVQVNIQSKDEYPPEFTYNTYHFTVPGDAPVGYVAGKVNSVDRDEGVDGRIMYKFRDSSKYFKINSTSGVVTVRELFRYNQLEHHRDSFNQDISLVVVASSGRPKSLTALAAVELTIDFSLNASHTASAEEKLEGGLPAWGLGLVIGLAIIAIVLMTMIFFLRMRHKRSGKPSVAQGFDNSFDTIDIRAPPSSSSGISQFPPHYNDIAHFDPPTRGQHVTGATSEVSDQSHSASSGRGSVEEGEDVEDEEIRMINEGPLMQQQKMQRLGVPDSGIHDDDNLSDTSIQNTQEYLARLGINTSHPDARSSQDFSKLSSTNSVESMHMFDEEGGGEGDGMDISNLIYTKLNNVSTEDEDAIMDGTRPFGFGDAPEPSMTGSLSSIVHSEEELTGSYNWDYLLEWGPQYQPLAHVFAEIARLKDDSVPPPYAPKKTLNPQVKTIPPPLITNVAPCYVSPVALSSGYTSQATTLPSLPRSPITHESTFASSAMSPSFSPSLSPLATRTPSISPLVTPGNASSAQVLGLVDQNHPRSHCLSNHIITGSSGSETELQI